MQAQGAIEIRHLPLKANGQRWNNKYENVIDRCGGCSGYQGEAQALRSFM